MKFVIRHEIRGRIRVHFYQKAMSIRQADLLQYYLCALPGVAQVKIYERTADAVVVFGGSRDRLLAEIQKFSYNDKQLCKAVPQEDGRALNREYKERLIQKIAMRAFTKAFLPMTVRAVYTVIQAAGYLVKGIRILIKGRLEVEVLDAAAIVVSIVRRDFDTARSVMFLLGIGGLLEEWTHKKSVGDLARSMSLNISKVWQNIEGQEVLVPVSRIREGDLVTVHMGNVIPLDGVVVSGQAMVNQASMTGESVPAAKEEGMYVYAGTAVEEGEITLCVKKAAGATRFERIVTMIEESEQLKSTAEGKAASLADALVPWSLGGTALTWLLTRSTAKALSILMVDFSCALKLAMPLSVLSAMREASGYHITVKGGKYMEALASADTIVFDKTGTLTKARPQVADVVITALRRQGITKIVMMTGDSERTARAIAERVGVDEYYSEALPEEKAFYVEKEKKMGHKVIMIGDGINDSPALSAADAGIAISEGAEIAREIADIIVSEDSLFQLVTLRAISSGLMDRIHRNYRFVIGFNLGLIMLGIGGVITPATSALLHNTSTLAVSLKSMTNLLD